MYKIGGYVKMNSAARERFKLEYSAAWLEADRLKIVNSRPHEDKKPGHYILTLTLPGEKPRSWSTHWLEEVTINKRNLPEWF